MEMVASVVEVVNKFLWDYALLIPASWNRNYLFLQSEIYSDTEVRRGNEENVRRLFSSWEKQ